MGSARYIGRVGGLAVALGVGAAVFGAGAAWADSPSSGSSAASASSGSSAGSSAGVTKHAGAKSSGAASAARAERPKSVVSAARTSGSSVRTVDVTVPSASPAPQGTSSTTVTGTATDPDAGNTPAAPTDSPAEMLQLAFTRRQSAAATTLAPAAVAQSSALIFSPSGVPIVSPGYLAKVFALYVKPNSPVGTVPEGVNTPEGLYPITGVKSLPLNTSVEQGLAIMDAAIKKQLADGNAVTIFGYSQSAIIASLEMGQLDPSTPISFILTGNEMNPNGGFLSRFPGLTLPSLGIPFYGATPPDSFPVTNYTLEYDGFADFPRYPLNILADLNAGLGIVFVHTQYAELTPDQVTPQSQGGQAIELPTSSPTQHYYIIPTENLPLLAPVRAIPLIGTPLADLLQPALKVLVNLGYGDPKYGYSTGGFANEVTPFGFLPDVDWGEVAGLLISGVAKGVNDFVADFGPNGLIARELSSLNAPTPEKVITDLVSLPVKIAADFSGAIGSLYAALLPTADIINAIVTVLPAYSLQLFLQGIEQAVTGDPIGGLVNAIGLPIAATVGLVTTATLIELLVVGGAVAGALNAGSYS